MEDFSKYSTQYLVSIMRDWRHTSVYDDIMEELLDRTGLKKLYNLSIMKGKESQYRIN